MITGHGDDAWKYAVAVRADFSSNVYYGALDPGLAAHLRERVVTITHYPEPAAESLQAMLEEDYGVKRGQVLITNGATEAIYLIAQMYRGAKAIVFAPTFAEYADACGLYGIAVEYVAWENWEVALPQRTEEINTEKRLFFLCNPNNPTGKALPVERLLLLVQRYPLSLFVIDESYIAFTQATKSMLDLPIFPNVLVLRSLTKSCRIPGLRIGYVIGPDRWMERLRAVKMPWSVNRLAIEAGLYIFRNPADFAVPVESLLRQTSHWQEELRAATGWKVHGTDTHYFLMETPEGMTAAALKLRLVSDHGLLVRDAGNFRGLGPRFFRVACQSSEHNHLLTEALRECAQTG